MGGTVSDWIIAMRRKGILDAEALHSEKLEDYQRLKESGLPVFEDFVVPFAEFHEGNEGLLKFLARHDSFVVRAIPHAQELPRRYKIGVSSFDECSAFLSDHVRQTGRDTYSVFLTQYEPNIMGGIIISREDDVLIEISPGSVDELSHGQLTPYGGHFAFHGNDHFRRMTYTTEDTFYRDVMWRALGFLKHEQDSGDFIPRVDFMKGYFEFVVTRQNSIVFLDYKTNPAYVVPDHPG